MEGIPYASAVGSLVYAQTCTRPDISFAVGMLGRYQINPGLDHWKAHLKEEHCNDSSSKSLQNPNLSNQSPLDY